MEFSKYTIKPYQGHRKKVLDMGWNKEGTRLVSGSADGSIRVWKLDTNGLEKESEYKAHKDQVKI
jgi:WD40 repeat protein